MLRPYRHAIAWTTLIVVLPVAAQRPVPLRALTAAVGTDSALLRSVTSINPLSDGRVLVNDMVSRRVLLFDSTLAHYLVVLDTAQSAKEKYAPSPMTLTRYLGDSTLLLDANARAFTVISPAVTVARVMAFPIMGQSITTLLGFVGDTPRGFDPAGRLIYYTMRTAPRAPPPLVPKDSGATEVTFKHDSLIVLRLNIDTKAIDTMALVASASSKSVTVALGRGGYAGGGAVNPFPAPDEWALLPDGTVAVVRSHDYHIDWVSPDLKRTSTPKMPFDWKPIPDEEKQRLSDSLRKAAEDRSANATTTRTSAVAGRPVPSVRTPPVWYEPKEMEQFYPPIRRNTVRSDPEGNVWVLPTTSMLAGQGLVYDVVNRNGEIIERVRLSEGRNLVAVGAGGVVYMSYTPKGGLIRLERARIIR